MLLLGTIPSLRRGSACLEKLGVSIGEMDAEQRKC